MSAKKGKRNMRQTLIMAVLCIVLISGATFAWFTLSDTARISNLTLTVGEATSLQIAEENSAKSGPDVYKSELVLKEVGDNVKLLPATVKTVGTVLSPKYVDGAVTDTETIDTATEGVDGTYYTFDGANAEVSEKNVYYLEKTFYLRTDEGSTSTTYNVVLAKGEGLPSAGYLTGDSLTGTEKGTYMLAKKGTGEPVASSALRISFECAGTTSSGVFEPNTDMSGTGSFATDSRSESDKTTAAIAVKQNKNGTFTETFDSSSTESKTLFTIKGSTDNKIVMKVWVEGTDAQCVDEISMDSIIGSLKFALKP